jgi:LuxR family maltose regulon positive regulatory protein
MINKPTSEINHLIRPRLNALFEAETSNRVVAVCGGTGSGKTCAVYDFLKQQKIPFFWVQLTESDNVPVRLWENMIDAAVHVHPELANICKEIGFPDTPEKVERFLELRRSALRGKPYIVVCDDMHLLTEPEVLNFMGKMISGLTSNLTMFMIYRNFPEIDIKVLQTRGLVSEVNESDLNFTKNELSDYTKLQGLALDSQIVHDIFRDTGGWAFAVNLVARSLKRVPRYTGFVKSTLKPNIFGFMESENWNDLSERLRLFLLKLSLVDHISTELAMILANRDESLLLELRRQSAYVYCDIYGGAYVIHHLYLDFLISKQHTLSDAEKTETYRAAAEWCDQNNFKIDALGYYEKLGDYESVVSVAWGLYSHMPRDVLECLAQIIERAPERAVYTVNFMPSFHLFTAIYLGRWDNFVELAESYEKKILSMPDTDYRRQTLGAVYYLWGKFRHIMCTFDGNYDFDWYFTKAIACWGNYQADVVAKIVLPHGAWVTTFGCGTPEELSKYTKSFMLSVNEIAACYSGINSFSDLYYGELKFYRNDLRDAESHLLKALEHGRKHRQFETMQRALFYLLRISVAHGDSAKTEQTLRELEELLDESSYSRRNVTYDITIGWHYCTIRQFEMISNWMKGEFAAYSHAHFIENFSNRVRARYHYLKRNYLPLLAYIEEMKDRESILYGRVEMLALEACVHYQMKNKQAAWDALKEAYEAAAPCNILMPFVELGKDMRTLTASALRAEPKTDVPRSWLERVKQKSSSYAKHQSMFINEQKLCEATANKALSPREHDVLKDLYSGFSQPEIAKKHSLSINTVKMVTKSIYEKLNVHKISDLIRVAAEQKLV